MVSKNVIKQIRALSLKKHRDATGLFVAEGPKVVGDLLPLLHCEKLFLTPEGMEAFAGKKWGAMLEQGHTESITQAELERLSMLKSPHAALGVFRLPQRDSAPERMAELARTRLCLALDGVQDPGNLGTIIRIADWFGIEHIFVTADTADAFSPKVVQATMGAIGRVSLHQVDLASMLETLDEEVPVFGTFLDGDDMYGTALSDHGIVVMGNEGKGISAPVAQCINRRLFIPSFPTDRPTSESLNVAVATAVVCAEFRRRMQ